MPSQVDPKIAQAIALIESFKQSIGLRPQQIEQLIVQVFEACGQSVTEKGFVHGDTGVDCFFRTDIDGRSWLIGVEVKAPRQLVDAHTIEQALASREDSPFDRILVISRSGFMPSAFRLAASHGLGKIDLLDPDGLQNWILKNAVAAGSERKNLSRAELIINEAMKKLAQAVAEDPEELWKTEWRDLERMLSEVFSGLGFHSTVTRPGKDGGFDLELRFVEAGSVQTYLVEVKHWKEQKAGRGPVKKFIEVTAQAQVTGGLFLSSSGFASTVSSSSITEISAPVRLADSQKIVSLCQTYYRVGNALWTQRPDYMALLTSDAHFLSDNAIFKG